MNTEKEKLAEMLEGSNINDVLTIMANKYGSETVKQALEIAMKEIKDENGMTEFQRKYRTLQGKFGDIIREVFLSLSEEEEENGTTVEQKSTRYDKWYKPMVDEIMAEIEAGSSEIQKIVDEFSLDKASHVQNNKWYSPNEAYIRDVQYKLLPELYEKVQDRIKAEYEANKTPYVIMYSSESPLFPSENKVYTVKEFNELLIKADSEFYNRKKYAEEKYGCADNYWDLERDNKLPEEDKGIQFGYDKTNFKFFNIPNPRNPGDTFSYEPSRYDIGDGNGSVYDYVRSTCSHDEFIEAINELRRNELSGNKELINFYKAVIAMTKSKLESQLVQEIENFDIAQEEYKELHKKWLIDSSEADSVDENLKDALDNIYKCYVEYIKSTFRMIDSTGIKIDSPLLINEVESMVCDVLYKPSRDAQKAMNAEDYITYNSFDWAKQRRIWERFPANVNLPEWIQELWDTRNE